MGLGSTTQSKEKDNKNMNIKQLNKGTEYLTKFGVAFSKMVEDMDSIVSDAELDYEKGNITDEQLNYIRKMADYFENVNYRNIG